MSERPTYVYDPERKPIAYEPIGRINRMEYDAGGDRSSSIVVRDSLFGRRESSIGDRVSSIEDRLAAVEARLASLAVRDSSIGVRGSSIGDRLSSVEPMGQITNMTYDAIGVGVSAVVGRGDRDSSFVYRQCTGYPVAMVYFTPAMDNLRIDEPS